MIDELIQKFIAGKCNRKDLEILKKYFDADSHVELVKSMSEVWNSDVSLNETSSEQAHIWNEINSKIKSQRKGEAKVVKLRQWSLSVAAGLIIVMGLSVFLRTLSLVTIHTINESANPLLVQLEDGTDVWLKTGASLEYSEHFDADERLVTLEGEAYFEVAHNANKPFKVAHNNSQTIVLGTRFNVNTSEKYGASVSLFDGSVKLKKSDKEWLLKPGEKIANTSISSNAVISKFDVSSNNILAWKLQKFEFKNQPLSKVIETLEEHYNVDVEFDKNALLNKNITCVVNFNTNIDNAMHIILFPHQLNYHKDNEKIIVKKITEKALQK